MTGKPLALFYKTSLNWNTKKSIVQDIIKIRKIRDEYSWFFDGKKIEIIKTDNPKVLGFYKKIDVGEMLAIFNSNFYRKESFQLKLKNDAPWENLISGETINFSRINTLGRGKFLLAIRLFSG